MALAAMTFKFWTDSNLTVAFSNLFQLQRYTDLSDGAQDFVLYFGSDQPTGDRQCLAVSNPGVDNITLTPTDNLAAWQASHAYVVGDRIEPTTPNTYSYQCTVAGTSAASEPTWPTTPLGSTVTSGGATFTLLAKKHPTTEIKLALSSIGLDSAVAGAALNLGTQILSGSANAVPVYFRFTNTVVTVSDDTGYPELSIDVNSIKEVVV